VFDSLLSSVATHLTVAVLDDRVVGYSVVIHVIDEGELANVAVDASARRRGVARALMDALTARARRDQLHSMFLEVRESNVGARALYEAFGFSALTRRKGYYQRPDEDAIVMVWRPGTLTISVA
jgi:ribosomal-protein-alanine N-acetyltransferase